MIADPRIVPNPKSISVITYRELRELSYMGATVLHEDAIFPVKKAGIPIHIRNTNAPNDDGTLIVTHTDKANPVSILTGIARQKRLYGSDARKGHDERRDRFRPQALAGS